MTSWRWTSGSTCALADAAGNAVVSAMMGSLRESIQGYAATAHGQSSGLGCHGARLQAEHRGILAAIRNGDGDRAAKLVAAHIEGYYREAGVRHPRRPDPANGSPARAGMTLPRGCHLA